MSTADERTRELLPNILLTLLSIVQALALEVFWSHFQSSEVLWQGGWPALIGWLQAGVIVLGIAEIWLFYVSMILRFTWVPGVRDMVLPLGVGLLEFTLVDLQGSDRVGLWLVCLSLVFAVVITESFLIFKQARREPANQWFFENLEPATLRDYGRQMSLPAVLVIAGTIVAVSGSERWIALVSVLIGLCAMAYQIYITHYYWQLTISGSRS